MCAAPTIRPAEAADLPALLEIYNQAVEHTVATFDLEPRSLAEGERWLAAHGSAHHPLFVAVVEDSVAGYASLSPYRPMPAYDSTAELSLYIHEGYRRRGIATALMQHILAAARQNARMHLLVSVITAENAVSCRLHERFGFTRCGLLHEAGYKHGAYHDVAHYELRV